MNVQSRGAIAKQEPRQRFGGGAACAHARMLARSTEETAVRSLRCILPTCCAACHTVSTGSVARGYSVGTRRTGAARRPLHLRSGATPDMLRAPVSSPPRVGHAAVATRRRRPCCSAGTGKEGELFEAASLWLSSNVAPVKDRTMRGSSDWSTFADWTLQNGQRVFGKSSATGAAMFAAEAAGLRALAATGTVRVPSVLHHARSESGGGSCPLPSAFALPLTEKTTNRLSADGPLRAATSV